MLTTFPYTQNKPWMKLTTKLIDDLLLKVLRSEELLGKGDKFLGARSLILS